jgi:hypothetical protein
MDIGLAITNDALHYREPIPDFPIVAAAEDGWGLPPRGHTAVHFPALIQGQGFENVGDQTLFWYAPWPEQDSDGVRVASWPRDRLGHFRAFRGGRMSSIYEAHVVSAPIDLAGERAAVYLNVDGVGEHGGITVEVLDERFHLVTGYAGAACIPPSIGGFAVRVHWQGRDTISHSGPVRLRVNFTGLRPEDVRLYAIYVRGE